jgi:hypothetical protein
VNAYSRQQEFRINSREMKRHVRLALAVLIAVLAAASAYPANAADAALPIMKACAPSTPPELPQRWRAVALMMPFVRQQLDIGEFVYDGSLPAMRATIYGAESGAVDLLITSTETYQLSGPHDAPDACVALGKKYSPPTTRWLSDAVCDGEGPIASTQVQWWKMQGSEGRTQWQWYKAGTRLPWRVMFPARTADPAVIGEYGMSYFPAFTPIAQTNLAQLRDLCAGKATKASEAAAAAATARDLMTAGGDLPEAERAARIRSLIPGFSRQACSNVSAARWPDHFVMTGILSPIPFKWTPLPSMLYYDWADAGGLHAWMYETRTEPPKLELVSLLTKGIGYSIERLPSGAFACSAKSPGMVRPDWMSVAGCECKGVIDHNPELGPNDVSQIRACPVKGQGLRVNWSWHTTEGRPILFTEPGAIGGGLNIADYLAWQPGATMPRSAFELPRLCTHPDEAGMPPVGHGLPAEMTRSCSDCHTTQ